MSTSQRMCPEEAIIAQLRAETAAKGWNIKELAIAAELPWRALYRYMNGERSMPLGVLLKISEVLNVSVGVISERAAQRIE